MGNRMLNGSRKDIEEDERTGRSRSRSRARSSSRGGGKSGLAALATAGLGVLGTKKVLEHSRSRSRRRSIDSYDSRDGSPRRRRSRSRSIVDGARRSLAKIGLGHGPDDRREDDEYYDDRSPRRSRHRSPGYPYDDDYTSRGYMRGGRGDEYPEDDRSVGPRRRSSSRQRGGRSGSVSSSDLGDSDDDAKRSKSIRDRRHGRRRHDDY